MDYAQKLRAIRKAEGLTQKRFAEITGISLSTIRNYEAGFKTARAEVMERVVHVPIFRKYTLWLMHDITSPEAGQIAPSLSPDGLDETTSQQSTHKAG